MKYLPLIVLITTLMSCKSSPAKQENGKKYFEGFVETSESYSGIDSGAVNHLRSEFGVKVVTYVSAKGFILRTYIDNNGIIFSRTIYRPDSLKFYYFYSNSDTIYSDDVTRNSWNTTLFGLTKNSTIKILGHNVDIIKSMLTHSNSQKSTKRFYIEYYIDPNYLVNPLVYKNIVMKALVNRFAIHLTLLLEENILLIMISQYGCQ